MKSPDIIRIKLNRKDVALVLKNFGKKYHRKRIAFCKAEIKFTDQVGRQFIQYEYYPVEATINPTHQSITLRFEKKRG